MTKPINLHYNRGIPGEKHKVFQDIVNINTSFKENIMGLQAQIKKLNMNYDDDMQRFNNGELLAELYGISQ